MTNNIQRHIDRHLGNGQSGRLDYSTRRLRGEMPTSREAFLELMHAGNTKGPGSAEHADLMALYQMGIDQDSLPSASGGGVPRSINQTAAELNQHGEAARSYFVPAKIDPRLQEATWHGTSLADLGPETARQVLHTSYVDANDVQRAQIQQLLIAVDNSPATSLGISWETPDSPLEFTARSASMEQDPSGYTQWRQGNPGLRPGLEGLMIQAKTSDPSLDGISATGGGGGLYDHYEAQQLAAVRSGNLSALALDSQGMHQGEAGAVDQGDVISVQG